MKRRTIGIRVCCVFVLALAQAGHAQADDASGVAPSASVEPAAWETLETIGGCTARHECAFVEANDRFYLIGGRHEPVTDVFDPVTRAWSIASKPPLPVHHFQPVTFDGKVYVIAAFIGNYPRETPVGDVLIYDPATDTWETGPAIPEDRQRGSAGVVLFNDKLYIVGGIVNGHTDGYVPWLDVFDPKTGQWEALADAPRPRDHFQAAVVDGKLYCVGGRTTSAATRQVFQLTVAEVDVYDFATQQWTTLPPALNLPTQRAGTMTIAVDGRVIVLGGESGAQKVAHREVEAFDPTRQAWSAMPPLERGRHGTGVVYHGGALYLAAGCGNRGGKPELDSIERLELPQPD